MEIFFYLTSKVPTSKRLTKFIKVHHMQHTRRSCSSDSGSDFSEPLRKIQKLKGIAPDTTNNFQGSRNEIVVFSDQRAIHSVAEEMSTAGHENCEPFRFSRGGMSGIPPPKRFYRTFWRAMARKVLICPKLAARSAEISL